MGSGSTVKMGVDVTQFKQGMREAQNSVKTLDAELKRSKAEFEATGNKEKYMADQAKLLKQKLEDQKVAIKNAEKALEEMRKNGVHQTSEEYQKMAQQLAAAQTGMYNTQAALNDLNTSQVQAAQSAGQLTNNIAGISKKVSLQQVLGGLKSIDNVLKSSANYAIQIGRNLYGGLTEGAAEADDLLTLSLQTGIDVETLQKMTLAGKIFDTSVDTIVAARRKLNRNVQGENKNVDEALEALGIKKYILTSKDKGYLEKKVKDSQDLFWEIGEALMNEPNEDRRDTYAQTLFGRNFDDLYPLFSKGREEYESFLDSQSAVSEENIKKLGELSDQLDKMNYQFEMAKTNLLSAFAPALEKVSGVVTDVLEEFNKYLETPEGQQKMEDLTDAVTSLFDGLNNIDPEDALSYAIGAIDTLKSALEWIGNNWEGVVTGLKAIVGVWTGTKVLEGATTIINMVNGLKGLNGGDGGTGTGTSTNTVPVIPTTNQTPTTTQTNPIPATTDKLTLLEYIPLIGTASHVSNVLYGDLDKAVEQTKNDAEFQKRANEVAEFVKKYKEIVGEGLSAEQYGKLFEYQAGKTDEIGIDIEAELKINEEQTERNIELCREALGLIEIPAKLVFEGNYWAGRRPVGGGSPLTRYIEDAEGKLEGFANGIWSVPWDGYPAILHKGERVLTARENKQYTYYSNTYFGDVSLHNGLEVDSLVDSIDRQHARKQRGFGS